MACPSPSACRARARDAVQALDLSERRALLLSFRAAIAVFFTFSFLALSAIGAAPQVRCVRHSVAGPSGTRKYEKGRARVRFARVLTPPPVCVLGSSCCSRRGRVLGDASPLRRHSLWFGECGVCPSTQVDGCYARSWVTLARLPPSFGLHPPAFPVGPGILGIPLPALLSNMVVSRCRDIGPPSGIPSSGLCFCWLPICVVIQLQTSVPRGVSIIPRAVSLRVYISQSTGILGIPLPALLSNIPILLVLPCILFPQWA